MGAQLRVFRRRTKSVQATKKITRAMELIASSRIVKAQARVAATEPYSSALYRAISIAASNTAALDHPLLRTAGECKRAAVLVISADRGLAGAFSPNVIKQAEQLVERNSERGAATDLYVSGRKANGYYSFRNRAVAKSWSGASDAPEYARAEEMANALLEAYLTPTEEGGVDEIYIVYTHFINRVSQNVEALRLLPLQVVDEAVAGSNLEFNQDSSRSPVLPLYEFEPDPEQVLDSLLPHYLAFGIWEALLQSAASEHAARQRAMKSATDNASDLIKTLTRQANQARQAEITQEISEIVGGADALASAGK
ncbi:MAG: F0F1 ATP synthase subunit gamma [Actinobacteria bacterium]|jgi:F-type H+-transporting ATPase subunit gamma|nr:F0F1 ATP synthase subunit gamma [Actinomycetota bacterium]